MSVKHKIREINPKIGCTIIIGQNPGKATKNQTEFVCWMGNRAAKLVNRAIEGLDNIILTNVCNYTTITEEGFKEGMEDILKLVDKYRPSKVICLGEYSYYEVSKFLMAYDLRLNYDISIYKVHHPSYVFRFSVINQDDYIKELRELIK